MKCLICNANSNYFFSKEYKEEPFNLFMTEIGIVKYLKCSNCGFTFSETHFELNQTQFEKLNHDYHTFSEKAKNKHQGIGNPPPYLEQAFMIAVLAKHHIIDETSIIDYAGGYGKLSNVLKKYYELSLPIYDPYIQSNNKNLYVPKEHLTKYKTVINSAFFEHITSRSDLDEINSIVKDQGVMIIHTVICENIPKDENWFYIRLPVHCAFHTNKSMSILMNQWEYKFSLYCPSAKSWILSKADPLDISSKVELINKEFQRTYLIYKKGFVDYWKGF